METSKSKSSLETQTSEKNISDTKSKRFNFKTDTDRSLVSTKK
jgi:hypothetical protein